MMAKPEGKRSFGRPMRKWENNIEKELQEIRWKACIRGSDSA
jgi:hypothetical protein